MKNTVRLLAVMLAVCCVTPFTASAARPDREDLRYNNTISTDTLAQKAANKKIRVTASFLADDTLDATGVIDVTIKKIVSGAYVTYPGSTASYSFNTYYGSIDQTFPTEGANVYLVNVRYTISGNGGAPDVITYTAYIVYTT